MANLSTYKNNERIHPANEFLNTQITEMLLFVFDSDEFLTVEWRKTVGQYKCSYNNDMMYKKETFSSENDIVNWVEELRSGYKY